MDNIYEKIKKIIVCLSLGWTALLALVCSIGLATGNIRHNERTYPESYCHVSFKRGASCKDPVTEHVVAYGYMLFLGGVFLTAGALSDIRNIVFFPVVLVFGLPVWISFAVLCRKAQTYLASKKTHGRD